MKKYESLFLGLFIGMFVGSLIGITYTFPIVAIGCLIFMVIDFINFIFAKKDIKNINIRLNQNKI